MKRIRNIVLATFVGISTLISVVQPVYAQKIFIDPGVETPLPAIDPELKKVMPIVFADIKEELNTASQTEDVFAPLLVDTTKGIKNNSNEKVMPIATDDIIGVSTYFSRFHPGIDIRAKVGTSIHAILDGIVTEVEYERGGYGRYVVLVHHEDGKATFSLYAHMKETKVSVGEEINAGDTIGMVGLTGHTTGPHLHFEVHNTKSALDPISFFSKRNLALAKK